MNIININSNTVKVNIPETDSKITVIKNTDNSYHVISHHRISDQQVFDIQIGKTKFTNPVVCNDELIMQIKLSKPGIEAMYRAMQELEKED